jgi:O-antigen/teichoic acid export membrane protein
VSAEHTPDDRPFARLLRNALTLFSGNVGAQLVGLLATILAGRALGPEAFGVLALLQTYVLIVDMLVNFQSWQALITFGSDALAHGRRDDFKALIKMGALLDLGTAVIGTVLAIALAGTYARLQGWEPEMTRLAMLYSLVILVHLSGVSTAVLRLFDRFRLIAAQQIAASTIRVVGVLVAIAADADLTTFVVVWILAEAGGYVTLLAMGWRELSRQGYTDIWRTPIAATRRRYPSLLSFVVTTNLNLSLKLSAREADTMIVGATLGDAPAGIYKIAKQLAGILAKVADPLYQAVFPELARLWSRGSYAAFRRLVVRATLLASAGSIVVWVGFLLLGKPFIGLTVGDAYVSGHGAMLTYMAAIVLAVAGFALSPAMLAMGRPKPGFVATLVSTIAYFATLYAFLSAWQLVGAGLAYVLYYVVWTAIMGTLVARAGRGAA